VVVTAEVIDYSVADNLVYLHLIFTGRLRWQISQLLLQHTELTPQEIIQLGLSCKKIKSYLEFSYVESPEQYREVLKLRRKTYSEVNKMEVDRPLEKLQYFFDEYSDILIVRHGNKIIGCAAIIYGNGKDKPFEVQSLMADQASTIIYNENMIEVAALCILKDYRKTDILHGVFENICFAMMRNNKDYIIASSDEVLARTYKGIGFKATGHSFIQPKYNDLVMQVLIVNKDTALKASNVKFFHWWPIWGEIVKYMNNKSVVKIGYRDRLKLLIRELGYKFMRLIIRSQA
jgi:hypothetical protein